MQERDKMQISIFDVLASEDIRVGNICKLVPCTENAEYYDDLFPQIVGKNVQVIKIENQNANAVRPGAWIRYKDIVTIAYFDDLQWVKEG